MLIVGSVVMVVVNRSYLVERDLEKAKLLDSSMQNFKQLIIRVCVVLIVFSEPFS